MCGWLSYISEKHSSNGQGAEGDILGMVVSGIGSSLKLGFKALAAKQNRKYFSLKSTHLYYYAHERSREADNSIELKQTTAMDISQGNAKEFYIIAAKKIYRMECEHEQECLKWVNSLKAARDGTFGSGLEDPNDASRYEKLKIYSRITGKSMYVDYDTLLETYEEKVHELIEVKLIDQLNRNKKWKNIEAVI